MNVVDNGIICPVAVNCDMNPLWLI